MQSIYTVMPSFEAKFGTREWCDEVLVYVEKLQVEFIEAAHAFMVVSLRDAPMALRRLRLAEEALLGPGKHLQAEVMRVLLTLPLDVIPVDPKP